MAHLRTLTLLLLALTVGTAPLSAQGVKQIIESLTAPAKSSSPETKKDPPASEQIPWVEERIQAARQRAEMIHSEGFQAKFQAAGFPETRSLEMSREATEAIDGWSSSRDLLGWIAARESVAALPKPTPSIPSTNAEALLLDREFDDLKTQLARLDFDAANQTAAAERAEEQSRSAKRELAQLRLDAEATLAATARDRSDVQILHATIREDAANAQVFLQRWLGYRLRLEAGETRARADLLAKILEESGYSRLLSSTRASTETSQIQKNLPDLEKEEQTASESFEKAAARLSESRSRLDTATAQGTPTADLSKQVQADLDEYSHLDSMRNAARFRAFAIRQTFALWSRVLELGKNADLEKLRGARRDIADQSPNTSILADRLESVLTDKQSQTDKWRQDLRMPGLSTSDRNSLQDRIKKNQALIEKLLAVKDEIDSLRTLQSRLLQEIDTEIEALIAGRHWISILQNLRDRILSVWNFTIAEQGDRSFTLGTIITALLAFIVSLTIARFTARRLTTTLGHRLSLPGSSAHLIEKLTLYSLSLAFALIILQWLQIPLTIFAFLGGALAVGIGFGSQNLINNFISGLLLLLERQINVGDLVEVDGNFGRVTNLGSRCSSIRKFDGVEVLVPNSALLEKNVINWTLSDPNHRFDFPVGVAYGSDVDLVMRTLQEVLDSQPEILRDPAPEVAFEAFGDSALGFHVYYWLVVGTHSARETDTQLRIRIDRLFRERGIEMSFPQRDIHLIPSKPIPIRLERES
jgi:small-conductance mechanosensitive channel